jgi:RHS repeat-associated protein
VGWVHDNDFQIRSRSVSGAGTLTLAYDDDGLLIKAGPWTLNRDPQNGLLTGTSLGQITDQVTRNQFAEVIAYEATAGGTSLYSQTLERDAIGRIQEHTESVLGVARTYIYSYDEANRLAQVREDGQVVGTYSYDANGNRISVTTADGTVLSTHDDQDRLLTQGNTTFTYSANGELESRTTGGETTSYDYDSLGNLMEVALPDGRQIQYRMDGYGRRLAKLVNGIVVRKWLYADGLLPVAELDASDNLISVFNGSFMVRDGGTYRIITDHVGSPRLVVDTSTGEVAQQLTYDEWGNITEDTNPGFQPFGFAGGLYDPDTGLVRFGARDYDPLAGRWTAKDPIRFGGGTANLYAYANNNPVNYTDPEGLALESGWDAFNVGLGVTSFGANLYSGNLWGAAEDALGLTLDIGATAVPGVPGGAATFLQGKRAVKAADTILDAAVDLRKAKKSTGRTPRLDTDGAQDAVDNMENLDGFGDKLKKYKKDPAGELPFDRDAWLKDRRRTKQDMQKRFRDARGDAQEAIDDFSY